MNVICGWYVANSILEKSFNDRDNIYVTPLKLNCLIYLLYANYLYKTNISLCNEPFIKTKNGPVLPSVEFKFGSFRNNFINRFARDSVGKIFHIKNNFEFNECLSYIWSNYKYMSDVEIFNLVCNMDSFKKKEMYEVIDVSDILDDEIKRVEKKLEEVKLSRRKKY